MPEGSFAIAETALPEGMPCRQPGNSQDPDTEEQFGRKAVKP